MYEKKWVQPDPQIGAVLCTTQAEEDAVLAADKQRRGVDSPVKLVGEDGSMGSLNIEHADDNQSTQDPDTDGSGKVNMAQKKSKDK